MFAGISGCNREQIQRLLNGELSEAAQTVVANHLETCASCRQEMQSWAADESWWHDTRDALTGLTPLADYATCDLSKLRFDGVAPTTVPLDFLAPSDNPAMLGKLGEFEVLEEIGCGGMGIVLKGYDHELNRYVAIKVLHPHCATSAAARQRFVREAQAAAAIVHQHVVAIHAVDASHHPPYLVMPYVPGESLQQRLSRQGPLDVVDTLRIAQQVAEGLAAAHAQGLVHRDIKPGNILLERNVERVLLTDFGLARAADDASLTRSGVIAGTPQYMSPEQARGDQIDHRTDLFSLGTVLYTMLAGHCPFRAETAMGVLRRVCDETPRPLREMNPQVPIWLEGLISRLHAKQSVNRFESAERVAELLQRCLAHVQQPTIVRLPDEILRGGRSSSRRTARRAVVSLAMAILAGLCIWYFPAPGMWKTVDPRSENSATEPIETPPLPASPAGPWDDRVYEESAPIRSALNAWEAEGDF